MAHLQKPNTEVAARVHALSVANDHWVVLDDPHDVVAAIRTGWSTNIFVRGKVNCIYFGGKGPAEECLNQINACSSRLRKEFVEVMKTYPKGTFKYFRPREVPRKKKAPGQGE
jgi:uncharacterized Fe-S cluster-containing MiaB family protein